MAALELVVVRLPAGHAWLGKLATQGSARSLPDAIANVMRATGAPLALSPIVSDAGTQTARQFLGRRTALVLGAGGARGLAHIGVARALERNGVHVDLIVGTSMGGIIGALIACGWGAERLDAAFREIASHFRRRVLDLGLRSGSVFKGEKKRRLLEAETAGIDIETLPVPFATITADLTHAREHVIDRGPLAVALDATSAIPTLFPPVAVGDLRLVDGWITNPLPVDVARRLGADRVIAVDPCVDAEAPLPDPATAAVRPRFALFDASSLVRTAMRAMDVSARERAAVHRAEADVSIAPNLWHVSSTDVQRYAEIVEAGDLATEAALRATRGPT
jgi:NTE family protein